MNEEKKHNNQEVEYAGFWIRLLAYLVDGLLLTMIGMGISFLLGTNPFQTEPKTTLENIDVIITLIVSVTYYIVFWVNYDGATPGKRLFGIKIIKEDGKPVTYVVALVRYFSQIISGFVFCLGFLWVAWDGKKQGWHDKIAKTVVIRTKTIKLVAERVS